MAVFFHPDYTVGSGIGPDLLTLHIRDFALVRSTLECKRSRARVLAHAYRRWESHPALKTFVSTGEPARTV